jgi:hypothetical protein
MIVRHPTFSGDECKRNPYLMWVSQKLPRRCFNFIMLTVLLWGCTETCGPIENKGDLCGKMMLLYKLIIVRCFGETLHSGLTHIYSGKWSVCRHCTVMFGFFCKLCRASSRPENQGLGVERPEDVAHGDDEYDAYRKRMMLAYRFRPNPLVCISFILKLTLCSSDCASW